MATLLIALKDLATLTQQPETSARVELAARRASSSFVGAIGYPVVRVKDAVATLRGTGGQDLILPARPVEAATATMDGRTYVAGGSDGVTLDGRLGILHRPGGWPWDAVIEVTFTHGYPPDQIPGDIQDAVLERAAYLLETMGFVESETKGPFSRRFGATQQWIDTVERYRIGVGDRS